MTYEKISSLEEFLSEVETYLLDPAHRKTVLYPSAFTDPWDGYELVSANEEMLSNVSGSANLYAIFTCKPGESEQTLRYLGKTLKKYARERIKNHLFKKNEMTGAKLMEVVTHTCAGGTVAITWVEVHPQSLRNYLEEELIKRNKGSDWNRENKVKP